MMISFFLISGLFGMLLGIFNIWWNQLNFWLITILFQIALITTFNYFGGF